MRVISRLHRPFKGEDALYDHPSKGRRHVELRPFNGRSIAVDPSKGRRHIDDHTLRPFKGEVCVD